MAVPIANSFASQDERTVKKLDKPHTPLEQPASEQFLVGEGMRVARAEEWLSGEALGTDTWGACVIAVKE